MQRRLHVTRVAPTGPSGFPMGYGDLWAIILHHLFILMHARIYGDLYHPRPFHKSP